MNLVFENDIRNLTNLLVHSWEKADASGLSNLILPDATIDFDIFDKGLKRDELLKKLSERPRKISYARFETLNSIVVTCENKARHSLAMIGIYADENNGEWTKYTFKGSFALEFIKNDNQWFFSSIKFMLTDENYIRWPRLISEGIPQIKGGGDPSFVSNWRTPNHEDRIGWFSNKRMPAINPVYDSPWYGMENRIRPDHEEDLIQESFFRYAFGIDFNNFRLYEDALTDDCQFIYGDTRPYTKRGVVEFLKAERQGSPRCTHTGFFTDIKIDGDNAIGHLYLRAPAFHKETKITPEEMDKRHCWARYTLQFRNENGTWKIRQLNYYPGPTIK